MTAKIPMPLLSVKEAEELKAQLRRQRPARTGSLEAVPGERFGRLVVTGEARKRGVTRYWNCVCDCGNEKQVPGNILRRGMVISCGCFRDQMLSAVHREHGMSKSPEHRVWSNMLYRCYNPHYHQFRYYGGRGITVCKEWRDDFAQFFRDMGPRPSRKHSIERRENNRGYSADNCYWATQLQQSANRRNVKRHFFRGRSMILAEIARETGVDIRLLWDRLKRGLTIEEAIL